VINEVFAAIASAGFPNLLMINLSENYWSSVLNVGVKTYPRLRRVHVDRGEWEAGTFPGFLEFLFNCDFRGGLELSVTFARVLGSDFTAASQTLCRLNTSQLTELYWNGNRVDQKFLQFLKQSLNLRHLGLRGCVGGDTEILRDLGAISNNLPCLQTILLSGRREIKTGPALCEFLDQIHDNAHLLWIDVSYNSIGEAGHAALCSFARKNSRLSLVGIDGTGITSCKPIDDLLACAVAATPPFKCAFPAHDLETLIRNGAIDKAKFNALKKAFDEIASGKGGTESRRAFDYPAFETKREVWPLYLSTEWTTNLDVIIPKRKQAELHGTPNVPIQRIANQMPFHYVIPAGSSFGEGPKPGPEIQPITQPRDDRLTLIEPLDFYSSGSDSEKRKPLRNGAQEGDRFYP
jgi:hypothetical protein